MRTGRHLLGVVMAGGKSSRMGRDKALLKPWGPAGPTMLGRAFGLLGNVVSRCIVSCAPGCVYAGYPCQEDLESYQGPAQGVCSGLALAARLGCGGALVLACDLPLITGTLLARLVAAHAASAGCWATCYAPQAGGKVEMLVAVYDAGFLPHLRAGLAAGEKSLFRLVPREKLQCVPYASTEAELFRNCNTPADMALP